MKRNHEGTIKDIKQINKSVYLVRLFVPTIDEIFPGEYISILCEGLTLRRPFSVADFDNHVITVLIKKRGKGTDFIVNLNKEDKVEISAPLGNGFKIENKKTLLIGAGIGVAPLFYLDKKLGVNAEKYFAAGFTGVNDIVWVEAPTYEERQSSLGMLAQQQGFDFVSTDDGSNGNKGSICDYLDKIITEFKPEKIVSCAPHPVLECVAKTAQKYNIECDVCMEKVMACGIGICRGCIIKVKKGNEIINKTVCKDGPVFSGTEVIW